MGPVGAGIVGLGRIAADLADDQKSGFAVTHLQAYAEVGAAQLLVAVDPDPVARERFRARWPECSVYESVDRAEDDHQLDVISICTPTKQHIRTLQSVCEMKRPPKAILCEKPFGASEAEARQMAAMARESGISANINYTRRFCDVHQRVREWVAAGRIGRVQSAHFAHSLGVRECGGHLVDLARFFFGELTEAQTLGKSVDQDDPTLKGFFLAGPDEIPCYLDGLDAHFYNLCEFEIFGTAGRISSTNYGYSAELFELGDSAWQTGQLEFRSVEKLEDGFRNAMTNAIENTVEMALGTARALCPPDEAIACHRVVDDLIAQSRRHDVTPRNRLDGLSGEPDRERGNRKHVGVST